jgi:CRISPR system Cascade subunit CasC
MFVELHILQNFAPSCLNRDDTNAPKDCDFGGYRRARISSQCIKRAVRTSDMFSELVGSELGMRTKLIPSQIAKKLKESGKGEWEAQEVANALSAAIWGELDEKGKSKVLIFASEAEIGSVVKTTLDHWADLSKLLGEQDKEKAKKASKKKDSALNEKCAEIAKKCKLGELSPDIALFGRMVAEKTELNVDAACQVAHAISTNVVSMEMDFYTAVDDLQPKEEAGAGMMGTVQFDSACFYRFSVVNMDQLIKNLGGDLELAHRTLDAYIRASVSVIPTGKQNSMAALNPPSLVMTVVRTSGQPMSLANAFVLPVGVEAAGRDLVSESVARLDDYAQEVVKMYGKDGVAQIGVSVLGKLPTTGIESAGGKRFSTLEEQLKVLERGNR